MIPENELRGALADAYDELEDVFDALEKERDELLTRFEASADVASAYSALLDKARAFVSVAQTARGSARRTRAVVGSARLPIEAGTRRARSHHRSSSGG